LAKKFSIPSPQIHNSSHNRELNKVLIISNSFEKGFLKYDRINLLRLERLKIFPKRYYIALLSVPVKLRKSHRPPGWPRVNKPIRFVSKGPFYPSESER